MKEADVALKWSSIRPEHVTSACERILEEGGTSGSARKGIVVMFRGRALPAKMVLSLAYQLANRLEPGAPLKFSSGEGAVTRLRGLGFEVVRIGDQK